MNWPDHLSDSRPRVGTDIDVAPTEPVETLYGAQTRLALENFAVPGPRLSDFPVLLRALAAVKIAAARANVAAGAIGATVGAAIEAAGQEILSGAHVDQFPLPVVQGGGGTSSNMNMNEVLATRAGQLLNGSATEIGAVHPNDHVNRSQSTNDVMPTAIAVAVHDEAQETLVALDGVCDALLAKSDEYSDVVHLGRTCLQDAVPIPVADVHRAQAHGVRVVSRDLRVALDDLLQVPLGATAIGTGLGVSEGYRERVMDELRRLTGLPLEPAAHPSYGLASLEPLVRVVDLINQAGRSLARIATDFRLLASGPNGGIAEMTLPSVQAGSSIMPGKTNPVIPELVMQISFQLSGAATTAQHAAAAGELEVSAMAPAVTLDLLRGLQSLAAVSRLFAERCIRGVIWNDERIEQNLSGSLEHAVVQALSDGYDKAADAARRHVTGAGR